MNVGKGAHATKQKADSTVFLTFAYVSKNANGTLNNDQPEDIHEYDVKIRYTVMQPHQLIQKQQVFMERPVSEKVAKTTLLEMHCLLFTM